VILKEDILREGLIGKMQRKGGVAVVYAEVQNTLPRFTKEGNSEGVFLDTGG